MVKQSISIAKKIDRHSIRQHSTGCQLLAFTETLRTTCETRTRLWIYLSLRWCSVGTPGTREFNYGYIRQRVFNGKYLDLETTCKITSRAIIRKKSFCLVKFPRPWAYRGKTIRRSR
ncbi:hypothetical protein Hypma_013632 [Hypsizygus marmoreus]|uniref:Uncharacterized protein n=1 Tax=Hypsizygus marmoreus TaxID=39966 RepID=A0A369JKJ5_HYPMA|nr:hypothetical protein Hypma_013632 [Hypsizygus marmoreus]